MAPASQTRAERERRAVLDVRPDRRNYLLPVAYNANPNRNVPLEEAVDLPFLGDALDDVEMKFQISFEVPLWTEIMERELDWSYPIGRSVRLYLQYFNGYGESLLDYDHSVNRVGLGFLLKDWP